VKPAIPSSTAVEDATRRQDPSRRALLVIAPEQTDRDGLFQELTGRRDFLVRYATSAAEAEAALRERAVVLLIAAPEVPTAAVRELLVSRERIQPGLPVLVIRDRQAEEPASWARRGVGVLRLPLLPAALSRSVDVVLGLRRP
jgi:DNA-binding NtrC family response regulator